MNALADFWNTHWYWVMAGVAVILVAHWYWVQYGGRK